MKNSMIGLALFCCVFSAFADEKCRDTFDTATPAGRWVMTACTKDGVRSRNWLALDGVTVLEDSALSVERWSKDDTLWIYRGPSSWEIGCPESHYLIDLNYKPVKVIQFGVKNACNECDWVSWGQKNSVIALKKNVRFIYKDGKVTPPKNDGELWSTIDSIPVPRGKTAADQPFPNYITPYAKELALPTK